MEPMVMSIKVESPVLTEMDGELLESIYRQYYKNVYIFPKTAFCLILDFHEGEIA